MVDHPSAPCPNCGATLYCTVLQSCYECGENVPPDFIAPEGWTRRDDGALYYGFGVEIDLTMDDDGRIGAALHDTENGERTGDAVYMRESDPDNDDDAPGQSGPALELDA